MSNTPGGMGPMFSHGHEHGGRESARSRDELANTTKTLANLAASPLSSALGSQQRTGYQNFLTEGLSKAVAQTQAIVGGIKDALTPNFDNALSSELPKLDDVKKSLERDSHVEVLRHKIESLIREKLDALSPGQNQTLTLKTGDGQTLIAELSKGVDLQNGVRLTHADGRQSQGIGQDLGQVLGALQVANMLGQPGHNKGAADLLNQNLGQHQSAQNLQNNKAPQLDTRQAQAGPGMFAHGHQHGAAALSAQRMHASNLQKDLDDPKQAGLLDQARALTPEKKVDDRDDIARQLVAGKIRDEVAQQSLNDQRENDARRELTAQLREQENDLEHARKHSKRKEAKAQAKLNAAQKTKLQMMGQTLLQSLLSGGLTLDQIYRLLTVQGIVGVLVAAKPSWFKGSTEQSGACVFDFLQVLGSVPLDQVVSIIFRGADQCLNVNWTMLGMSMMSWTYVASSIAGLGFCFWLRRV